MFEGIRKYCESLESGMRQIAPERRSVLDEIAAYILAKKQAAREVNLVFICTHNSRRSHFGQVWAAVAASYFGIRGIRSYSGGTEATAFHPNAIRALQRIGFRVTTSDSSVNPVYAVAYTHNEKPLLCFSKKYDHPENPQTGFAAIMTCAEAGESCPFIPGAELRVSTTHPDPKQFDGTELQDSKYDERCRQIATEMFYLFSEVGKKFNLNNQ